MYALYVSLISSHFVDEVNQIGVATPESESWNHYYAFITPTYYPSYIADHVRKILNSSQR